MLNGGGGNIVHPIFDNLGRESIWQMKKVGNGFFISLSPVFMKIFDTDDRLQAKS